MAAMKRACARFARRHSGYACLLDTVDSVPGYYKVYIGNGTAGAWYWFSGVSGFRQWAKYAVMEA